MSLNKLSAGVAGLVVAALVSGCNMDSVSLPGPSLQSQVAAVCELSNISEMIVCEALNAANVTMQNDCETTEKANYSSEGAINALYTAPTTAGTNVACPINVPAVGTCLLSDRTIYYYVVAWTAAAAQTDCTNSRNGQWQ